MTCDKYKGFIPLKRTILLWYHKFYKAIEWKIMYRPAKEDYFNIKSGSNPQNFEDDHNKFINRSSFWEFSYGCCNIEWDKFTPVEALCSLFEIFFTYVNHTNEGFEIRYMDLKSFLYELGKIEEFEEIRRLRYTLFIDDNFDDFEEYKNEIWCYEYCHPVLH